MPGPGIWSDLAAPGQTEHSYHPRRQVTTERRKITGVLSVRPSQRWVVAGGYSGLTHWVGVRKMVSIRKYLGICFTLPFESFISELLFLKFLCLETLSDC